ncbi:diaminopimelate decarboxylase [Sinorhizobium meliloti]|nr:diaminopimelate decarboxylase [Sinorhizobium meliloti]MQW30250.1 diaminopimelate decarboxylase [Sinorhizobium meliloti]
MSVHRAGSAAWLPEAALGREVARCFGTPAFVYNAEYLRQNYADIRSQIDASVDLLYSIKANPNAAIVHCLSQCGAGAEVSSHAELQIALRVGVDPTSIIFVGPAKSEEEIADCIRSGIYAIVVESEDELFVIDRLAAQLGCTGPVVVMLRVNPAFNNGGSGLTMSGKSRQFGIDVEQFPKLRSTLATLTNVRVIGFHMYMGTRYLDATPVVENTRQILTLSSELAKLLDIELEVVDVGGGFGVAYFSNEKPLDVDTVARGVNAEVRRFRKEHPQARIIIELGRYFSASCGVMLTSVRYKKVSRGETFAIVDGGTNLHMAAVGLGSFAKRDFPLVNLSQNGTPADEETTVTGPLCTPSDTIARRVRLGTVEKGDILAVLLSGAYGPSASPTGFLSHGFPNEVLVDGPNLYLVRPKDSVEDIVSRYRLPDGRSLSNEGLEFTLSVRLSASAGHYAGGVVDGAHILKLFGDAVTGLAARLDGDESLLQSWGDVKFEKPVRPGDFIIVKARVTKQKRLRRFVEVEAMRVVRATTPDSTAVNWLAVPERVASASGIFVIPFGKRDAKVWEAAQ